MYNRYSKFRRSIMSPISKAASLASPLQSTLKLSLKGAKFGLACVAKLAGGTLGSAIAGIYLNYVVAKSAYTVVSGYAGQYHELENGFQKVGFTPQAFREFFKSKELSSTSWDVTKLRFDRENILDVQNVLRAIYEHVDDLVMMQAMVAQIVAKVLVNKNSAFVEEGLEIQIPTVNFAGEKELVTYIVDKKFNLWNGIPAYGLIDKNGSAAPLLVFRATNTVLEEKDTLPTMVSNLHPKGPAWKLFSNSEQKVVAWLEKHTLDNEDFGTNKARMLGYSQGGILGAYFLTYHPHLFSKLPESASIILDAPGVSYEVAADWEKIEEKPHVVAYVNRGDLIPKVGDAFIGRAFEVRIAQNLKGFKSHQALSFFAPQWKVVEIAHHQEKKSASRSILSGLRKVIGKTIYFPAKHLLLPCVQSTIHS